MIGEIHRPPPVWCWSGLTSPFRRRASRFACECWVQLRSITVSIDKSPAQELEATSDRARHLEASPWRGSIVVLPIVPGVTMP